ncbi:MAG TPA: YjjG family noncanonical pyrimidine nucleotidase [Paludibacter sp.]|nr:YjjG family noncanonical pyrimidine nucleotidase [Paludibacter sp.]
MPFNTNPAPLAGRAGGYKYVFIDLDDTLWDFHANARIILNEFYDQQNLQRYFESFDDYFRIYAKRNLELWDMYGKGEITKEFLNVERFRHPMMQAGIDDMQLAVKTGTEFIRILPTRTILIPFAKELLNYLHANYPISIVSNGFVEVQYKKIESCGMGHYFSHVVLSENAGSLKPDKRIFEYALKLNGAKPSETIMIGDSYEADIRGAQNAGIDQVYFNSKINVNDTNDLFPATYKINRLEEILRIL